MATQTERREATRAALIEAAIDALLTDGYAGTTTARVAERAGLSRGAAPHYFASKADLVGEALVTLARERVVAIRDAVPSDPEHWTESMLDLIWDAHTSPIFALTVELAVAARADPQLASALAAMEREVGHAIVDAALHVAGPRAREPGFREDMELILATARGLALLPLVSDASRDTIDERWAHARSRLLRILGA